MSVAGERERTTAKSDKMVKKNRLRRFGCRSARPRHRNPSCFAGGFLSVPVSKKARVEVRMNALLPSPHAGGKVGVIVGLINYPRPSPHAGERGATASGQERRGRKERHTE